MKRMRWQASRHFRSKIARPVLVFFEFTKHEQGTVFMPQMQATNATPHLYPLPLRRGEGRVRSRQLVS